MTEQVRDGSTVDVKVWLLDPAKVQDAASLERCAALLSAEERTQQRRFHFEADRRVHVLTRASVRLLLSRFAPRPPAEWRFCRSSHGRPYILDTPDEIKDLSFNVSHTSGMIAVALTRGARVGVDVERGIAADASMDIAERYFAGTEVKALRAIPLQARPKMFSQYWTLKEAYAKATGLGLSASLDGIEFIFDASTAPAKISFSHRLLPDPTDWQFCQFETETGLLGATCVERQAGTSLQWSCSQFRPFEPDQEAAVRVIAHSATLARMEAHREPARAHPR